MKMVGGIQDRINEILTPTVDVHVDPKDLPGLDTEQMFRYCMLFLGALQIAIIIIFGVCSEMAYIEENFVDLYQMFTGIEIMMFFGFGYLMTFLKRYGMGAVGFTMLITVVGLQWGILTEVKSATYVRFYIMQSVFLYSRPSLNSGMLTTGSTSRWT